ncbi:glycosyltransferase family 2 protein [Desulfosporosinus hippei]|uniref:Rhamnosyltransferase n=1 Tax=Desulfosporosinus hippei DSM 8344 TaxID=1121419 RepID=A0A1G7U3I2_9FIRM|nr:glycosyltransferase family 2 protein [Desulfosporosinus hippei]SDG41997.1 rhamnosyltransferase [Desulfosporosinus hippei DSM 8344]
MEGPVQKLGAVIPIYNPSKEFVSVLKALGSQTYLVSKVIVIDSSPNIDDRNYQKIVEDNCGCLNKLYMRISPEEFDHGKTRNLGVSKLTDEDAVLFLTQDGIMSNDCVEKLVCFLNANSLSGVSARQLPREGATELEVIERSLTYPSVSRINSGVPRVIDDVLLSDVCSLFRIDALNCVGGFPKKIITAEDIVIANKLLLAGYKTGYCAEATIRHSHKLSFTDTVKRYFDTGVMHTEWNSEIPFNNVSGKGTKLVINEVRYIIRNKPSEFVSLVLSVVGKVIGYSLGRKNALLNSALRRKLSQNKGFWRLT